MAAARSHVRDRRRRRFLAAALAAAATTATGTRASAQSYWEMYGAGARTGAGLATDLRTGKVILFGGTARSGSVARTMSWDGTRWETPRLPLEPTPRSQFAMATDLLRARIVLFGGNDGSRLLGDTWEWDGQGWQQVSVAGPTPRYATAMAYDAARARMVLFGGSDSRGFQYDTWEWSGSSWTDRTRLPSPASRSSHAMAYDSLRGRILMAGGYSGFALLDTWEWNGAIWQFRGNLPQSRQAHSIAFDHNLGMTLLVGGSSNGTNPVGILTWNGAAWTSIPTNPNPTGRTNPALTYDLLRNRLVLFGGQSPTVSGYLDDTWEWDGSAWTRRTFSPPARFDTSLAFDTTTNRAVMFGGSAIGTSGFVPLGDTWQLRDGIWTELHPATSPSARGGASLVFDAARGHTLLFGGGAQLADTWRWDGSNWTLMQPAVSPPGRFAAAMAYDSTRREVVLFGGGTSPTTHDNDTWVWDGGNWLQRLPAVRPSPRRSAGFAHDPARHRTVLFGGTNNSNPNLPGLGDTWEWDGGNWVAAATGAPQRWACTMVFDAARRRIVRALGTNVGTLDNTLWEWDGGQWTSLGSVPSAAARLGAAAAFSPELHRTVFFGGMGMDSQRAFDDTWDFGYEHPAAVDEFGAACAGSAGTPQLADTGASPWLGTAFGLAAAPVPPNAAVQIAVGFDNTNDGGVALPRPLDTIGMPGCAQHVSLDAWAPATTSAASATASLAIPNSAPLVGFTFYCQALVADPAANALGFVTSNALACLIGAP